MTSLIIPHVNGPQLPRTESMWDGGVKDYLTTGSKVHINGFNLIERMYFVIVNSGVGRAHYAGQEAGRKNGLESVGTNQQHLIDETLDIVIEQGEPNKFSSKAANAIGALLQYASIEKAEQVKSKFGETVKHVNTQGFTPYAENWGIEGSVPVVKSYQPQNMLEKVAYSLGHHRGFTEILKNWN